MYKNINLINERLTEDMTLIKKEGVWKLFTNVYEEIKNDFEEVKDITDYLQYIL